MKRFLTLFSLFFVLLLLPFLFAAGQTNLVAAQSEPVVAEDAPLSPSASNAKLELISQIGGSAESVAVVGDYAYVGTGARLVIFDISYPSTPTVIAESAVLPASALYVTIANNYAYVGTYGGGLRIINVANPYAPYEVSTIEIGYTPSVAVVGNYAYVANGTNGLRIFDVTNPATPNEMGTVDIGSSAKDVAVAGGYAYVAAGNSGLHIINVANANTPSEVANYSTGDASGVAVAGNYAYIADGFNNRLHIINVEYPATPSEVSVYETSGAAVYQVTVADSYAYLATSSDLEVINVSNPAAPYKTDDIYIQGDARSLASANAYVFVAGSNGGLHVINVSDANNLSREARIHTWMAAGIAVADNYAYVSDGWDDHLYTINVSDPSNPTQSGALNANSDRWQDWRGVAVAGNHTYLAGNDLSIINVANPSSPNKVAQVNTGDAHGSSVTVVGNYAYVAAGENGGLRIINVASPSNASEVGAFDTPGRAYNVVVEGDYAYVADGADGGLRIINIATPSAPFEVGSYDTPGDAYRVAIVGSYAYIADGSDGGLRIIDISNPSSLHEVAAFETAGWAYDVTVVGDYAYVADYHRGLRVIDISTPTTPTEVASFDTPGFANGVKVVNGYIYVSDRQGGLLIFLLKEPVLTATPTATSSPTPISSPTATPAPTESIDLRAQGGLESINLSWNLTGPLSGDLDHYELYRAANNGNQTLITSTMSTQHSDDDASLMPNVEYCYQVNALNSAGQVIGTSNSDCASLGELTLWVPDQIVPPNSQGVPVTINLANGNGLCIRSLDIKVSYDQTIVNANGTVQPTIFTAGYAFEANSDVAGEVKISAIIGINGCVDLYGAGSLFDVYFDVLGNQDAVSPLDFITGLEATVIYDEDDLFTPVPLRLQNGSLTVEAAGVRGDVNGDGVVNAADAALALDISNRGIMPTAQQEAACDANADQVCNSADSSLILCYAARRDWVQCGGPAAQYSARQAAGGPVKIQIGPVADSQAGESIVVAVQIESASDLAGAQFRFTYDADKMTATGASLTSLTDGFELDTNTSQAGLLQVSLAADTPIGADGTILQLAFTVNESLSSINFGSVRLNDASGRDFATSALQREIKLVPHIVYGHRLYLPTVIR